MPAKVNYKLVKEHPTYRVGSDGTVWTLQSGKGWHQMKPQLQPGGFLKVNLNKKTKRVHRLVLEAFIGPCPYGLVGTHKNGDRTDNRLCNLKWGNRRYEKKQQS